MIRVEAAEPYGLWVRAEAIRKEIDGAGDATPPDIALLEPLLWGLEDELLGAAIHSMADAMAVLLMAGRALKVGRRNDGADERAYERALAWISEGFAVGVAA